MLVSVHLYIKSLVIKRCSASGIVAELKLLSTPFEYPLLVVCSAKL